MYIRRGRRAAPRLLKAYLRHIDRNGSSALRAERLVVVVHEKTLVARLRRHAATEVPLRMRVS